MLLVQKQNSRRQNGDNRRGSNDDAGIQQFVPSYKVRSRTFVELPSERDKRRSAEEREDWDDRLSTSKSVDDLTCKQRRLQFLDDAERAARRRRFPSVTDLISFYDSCDEEPDPDLAAGERGRRKGRKGFSPENRVKSNSVSELHIVIGGGNGGGDADANERRAFPLPGKEEEEDSRSLFFEPPAARPASPVDCRGPPADRRSDARRADRTAAAAADCCVRRRRALQLQLGEEEEEEEGRRLPRPRGGSSSRELDFERVTPVVAYRDPFIDHGSRRSRQSEFAANRSKSDLCGDDQSGLVYRTSIRIMVRPESALVVQRSSSENRVSNGSGSGSGGSPGDHGGHDDAAAGGSRKHSRKESIGVIQKVMATGGVNEPCR